jgi:hypothetical protein
MDAETFASIAFLRASVSVLAVLKCITLTAVAAPALFFQESATL